MTDAPNADATPLVTVGVPVYNGEKFLAETLTALQEQELGQIEIIVADNASTDGSLEIAERFANADTRFRILRSDVNRGPTWNFNRLLAAARAPFFMWNMADDVILPSHLLACRQLLIDHPEADLAFSRGVKVDVHGEFAEEFDDADLDFDSDSPAHRLSLFFRHELWHAIFSGLYRTEALRTAGGLQPLSGHDITLGTYMTLRGPFVQSPTQSYQQRFHPNQLSKMLSADPVKQTRVFNPSHQRPIAFPQWYVTYRVLVESVKAPVPLHQHALAVGSIVRDWIVPNWRYFPFDVKRNLIRITKGRYVGAYRGE